MKTKRITTLLIMIFIVINCSTGVAYASQATGELSTPSPKTETVSPEPSLEPTKTPDEIKETEITEIDYTPYLLVIIFCLAALVGIFLGHFIIYRIR